MEAIPVRWHGRFRAFKNALARLEMVDDRNKTSHLYDEDMAVDVIDEIIYTYYPLFLELQSKMERLAGD